jgi:transcriptional regulator with XRE-family HTH domain
LPGSFELGGWHADETEYGYSKAGRKARQMARPIAGEEGALMLLRRLLGDALRRQRLRQHRTLRDVSAGARVSLGYLSEVERGQKEASSELLASICEALGVNLSAVLREVSDELVLLELENATVAPALESLAGRQAGLAADRQHDVVAAA